MNLHALEKTQPLKDQRFLLPGYQTWEQFEAIEALMAEVPALQISYIDGCIELITKSSEHEKIKTNLCSLVETYFFAQGISFVHQSSSLRREEDKHISFEIEESFHIGKKKEQPDIAIDFVMIKSNTEHLEKYKRFNIAEVWFWEENRLSLYRLRDQKYEQISRSEFLPALDLNLLAHCVLMPSRHEARTEFLQEIRRQ